jgi:hypothetical protein
VQSNTLANLRRFLLAIIFLGLLGTGAELILLDHDETVLQYIPLLLIALAIGVAAWLALSRRAAPVRVWRGLMILFLISGVAGFFLHLQAKLAFTAEVNPALSGVRLFWEALRTQSPPALASGIMLQLGLLGLAYTYRHPALTPESDRDSEHKGEHS